MAKRAYPLSALVEPKSHNLYLCKNAEKSACCAKAGRAETPASLTELHKLRGLFWQELQRMRADPSHHPIDDPWWCRFNEVRDRLFEIERQIISARVP